MKILIEIEVLQKLLDQLMLLVQSSRNTNDCIKEFQQLLLSEIDKN